MPIEVEGPDGVVIEFPDGTPQATIAGTMRKRYPAPKTVPAKPQGQGSYASPYDLSGGQSRREIPQGSYYRDPDGNIRRNENYDAGNPIITAPRKPEKRGKGIPVLNELAGFAANLNRGMSVGDEFTGLAGTAKDILTGQVRPRVAPGDNPMGMTPFLRGVGDTFDRNMDTTRRVEDDFRDRRPLVAGAAQGAGMTATVLVPGGAMPAASTRLGAAAQGGLVGATQGAVMGALDRGTLAERGQASVAGGLIGGATGAALGGVLGGKRTPKPQRPATAVPTSEDLRVQKEAAYQAVDDAGVAYAPQAFDELADRITQSVGRARINPARHPKAASMLEDIQGLRGEPMTLTQLDQLRQVVNRDVTSASDEAEQFFGKRIVKEIDDFINGSPMMVSGSADDGSEIVRRARDLNTRFRKVQGVEEAVGRAERRAGATGSGGNEDNAIRQNIRALREKGRNFTPEEIAAMDDVIMGTPGQNALRLVGKLSPQGSGLMAAGNLGAAAVAGPLGAVPGAAGMASKYAADRITRQKVDDLLRLMAQGGAASQSAQRELAGLAASDPAIAELVQRLARGAGAAGSQTASPPRRLPAQR